MIGPKPRRQHHHFGKIGLALGFWTHHMAKAQAKKNFFFGNRAGTWVLEGFWMQIGARGPWGALCNGVIRVVFMGDPG